MLRLSTIAPTESEQEEAAQLAEQRKNSAEGDFLILSENKKKLQADIATLSKDIFLSKEELQENQNKISKAKSDLTSLEISIQKEKEIYGEIFSDRQKIENNNIDLKDKFRLDSKKAESAFQDIVRGLTDKKLEKEKEIRSLEDMKQSILDIVQNKKKELEAFKAGHQQEKQIVRELDFKKENLTHENECLENEIEKKEKNLSEKEIIIKERETQIEGLNNDIGGRQNQIQELDQNIHKKSEEYDAVKGNLFTIANRELLLNQKEAFIKNLYERAGMKFE